MNGDLGWRADGIQRARACGGIDLEVYRVPGFLSGVAVRRARIDVAGGSSGMTVADSEEFDWDPTPEDWRKGKR